MSHCSSTSGATKQGHFLPRSSSSFVDQTDYHILLSVFDNSPTIIQLRASPILRSTDFPPDDQSEFVLFPLRPHPSHPFGVHPNGYVSSLSIFLFSSSRERLINRLLSSFCFSVINFTFPPSQFHVRVKKFFAPARGASTEWNGAINFFISLSKHRVDFCHRYQFAELTPLTGTRRPP